MVTGREHGSGGSGAVECGMEKVCLVGVEGLVRGDSAGVLREEG